MFEKNKTSKLAKYQNRAPVAGVGFRVEAASYPAAPPTDPYVKISLIRFLGSDFSETKQARPRLAHNYATLITHSAEVLFIRILVSVYLP